MEAHAPDAWKRSLEEKGHTVRVVGAYNPVDVGCSQIIAIDPAPGASGGDGTDPGREDLVLRGASDPRSPDAGAVGR